MSDVLIPIFSNFTLIDAACTVSSFQSLSAKTALNIWTRKLIAAKNAKRMQYQTFAQHLSRIWITSFKHGFPIWYWPNVTTLQVQTVTSCTRSAPLVPWQFLRRYFTGGRRVARNPGAKKATDPTAVVNEKTLRWVRAPKRLKSWHELRSMFQC